MLVARRTLGVALLAAALTLASGCGGGSSGAPQVRIPLAMLNRHGLVAGATGTGKTKTLQLLGEQLSAAGVPVFVADVKGDLTGIRTGRATPGLVDSLKIDAYGSPTPLKQIASVSAPEPQQLVIRPFDPSTIKDIEKGIIASDLGLAPQNDGKVVRIPVPPLTEERRKELVRKAHDVAEVSRNGIRQARRDGNDRLKKKERDGELSQDDERRGHAEVQKLHDHYIGQVNEALAHKEKDILAV